MKGVEEEEVGGGPKMRAGDLHGSGRGTLVALLKREAGEVGLVHPEG